MSRWLISCGGTGGHLSPGIALAEGLVARGHAVTLLISHKKVDARLIEKYPGLRFMRLPGSGFGWNPVALIRFIVTQTHGFFFSLRQVRSVRPDGIVGFGGFTSASIIVAGALRGVPVVLHEANRVPGRAIRLLGRLAKRVYLPPGVRLPRVRAGIVRPMGLPVRREFVRQRFNGFFRFLITSADVAVRKPHPAIFHLAAARLGLAPADIWFVGDHLVYDIAGAKGAGMTALWYSSPTQPATSHAFTLTPGNGANRIAARGETSVAPDATIGALVELLALWDGLEADRGGG